MLKAIIFDCYDVLYAPAGPEYFDQLLAAHPAQAADIRDLGMQADYGYISLDQLAHGIAQITGDNPADVRSGLDGGHTLNQQLLDYVKQLRPRYKTAIISNMSSDSLGSIFTPDQLQELFDEAIISSQVGLLKPSPDIFLLAAQRLQVDTSECLFIDDQARNCDGARAVGMQALEYKNTAQVMQYIQQMSGPTPQ